MDLLQNLDLGTILLISIGCVFLCVIGLLVTFGLQIVSSSLGALIGIFDLVGGVIGGGPVSWCGCLVVLFACVVCAGGVILVTTCSANPDAMNFCLLLPR